MFLRRVLNVNITICNNYTFNCSPLASALTSTKTGFFRGFNTTFIRKAHTNMMERSSANPFTEQFGGTIKKRTDNIIKSQQDVREYRGLQLENGMKVLLVSDPTTDISAAALSVEVGHMSDPDYLPGLAHFCEHMLFLGTKKYPDENAYSTYLSQNGGSSNAATYANMTKYYFDVSPEKLDGALDRFAQFFIGPLFTESATEREINAVNSEHEKNVASDMWRIRQVNKFLAKPDHPYSKFGSGNKMTLDVKPKEENINIRDELIKFHGQWYSANVMCLAVFGKESLNDLEKMVVSKFSGIQNKGVELPIWPEQPYNEEEYGTKVFITPVKDIRTLTISFTTKDMTEYYKSSPEHYLSHLIGHEGKGSILSALRANGWCNDLVAGHSNTARGYGFFEINVDLTEAGMENVDKILKLIYQYFKLLEKEGPKKWIFEEYRNLNEMIFRFKDKESPLGLVNTLVHSMQIYPLEEVLSAPYLTSEWRPDLITDFMSYLSPKKSRVIIVGKDTKCKKEEIEPWYKTKFCKTKIPKDTIQKLEKPELNEKLKLPEPNPFIPTDFNLLPEDSHVPHHPVIILDSPILRVWHKQDTEFHKPKSCMNFDFSNPMVYSDPLNCNLTHMLVSLFRDQLNEYLYDAELAGLKFNVSNTTSGVNVSISGYSHKQQILLEKVLDHLFNFKIDKQRFEILKEEYIRALKNFKAEQPYQHAVYYLALILTENAWSKNELLDATQLLTTDRLDAFVKEFFSRLHAECFLYGNLNQKKAMDVADLVNEKLKATNSVILPLLSRQLLKKRQYKLTNGESYLFEVNNDYHSSSCAELYLQCEPQSDRSMIFADLLAQILTEPCYNTLRTKEQLGYIVFCGSRNVNGATGIRIIVQSARHPSYVEERIENFLEDMQKGLNEMSSEDFEKHKEALASKKLQKPKKLYVMFGKYLSEIALAQYHFDRAEAEVDILRTIKKEDLIDYYKTYVSKNSSERHGLSIHIISKVKDSPTVDDTASQPKPEDMKSTSNSPTPKASGEDNTSNYELPTLEKFDDVNFVSLSPSRKLYKIIDLSIFKSTKELYPLPRPFLHIRPKGAKSKL